MRTPKRCDTPGRYRQPVTWLAYVDESMRQRPDSSGLYVLAAAVFDQADEAALRDALRQLVRGRRRFHWREEEPADQRKAVSVVGTLDALHLVVVGVGLDNPRQERGRRQCLSRLLWELGRDGVGQVWLDARRQQQNRLDIKLVDSLRVRGELPDTLRVGHAFAKQEPLSWLPDIVAGAVSAAHGDGYLEHLEALAPVLREQIMVQLD